MSAFSQVAYQIRQRLRHSRTFVARNARELRRPELLRRKAKTFLRVHLARTALFLAALPFAIAVAIAIRLISLFVVVRIGSINASRIGHLGFDPEMQMAEKELGIGLPSRPVFDVFYPWTGPLPMANHQMLRMWARSLRLWSTWPWEQVDMVSRLLPWGDRHVVPYRKGDPDVADLQQEDVHGALRKTSPHVWFVDDELRRTREELRSAGVDPNREHVCLLVRDDIYLGGLQGGGFADHDFRNADIATYAPAIEYLVSRGYNVFRMGVGGRARLTLDDPRFLDYAFSDLRSELLDVYLAATCRLFISTSTGLDAVAKTFRRPLAVTNLAQLGDTHLTMNVRFIPKNVISREDGLPIPLSSQYRMGLQNLRGGDQYRDLGVEFVDNTAEEILDLVREADARIAGDWVDDPIDLESQRRFLELVPDRHKQGGVVGSIGSRFLQSHPHWMR